MAALAAAAGRRRRRKRRRRFIVRTDVKTLESSEREDRAH
jgi:hypothetical protein